MSVGGAVAVPSKSKSDVEELTFLSLYERAEVVVEAGGSDE